MAWRKTGVYDEAVRYENICALIKQNHCLVKQDNDDNKCDIFFSLQEEYGCC